MKAEYVQHVGTDLTVVNAARVSFDKESEWEVSEMFTFDASDSAFLASPAKLSKRDEKLIRYLAPHGHWTPFSHCFVTLRETVPIFVARQRFKHMVGFSYNEVSRRYVDSEPEFFTPEVWRKRAANLKQGSTEEPVDMTQLLNYVGYDNITPVGFYEDALKLYNRMLEIGVCPEQARMVLPQSMYTSYYVSGSLAAWARLYKQRIDGHAQKEIQDLATAIGGVIAPLFPVSWEALTTNVGTV